ARPRKAPYEGNLRALGHPAADRLLASAPCTRALTARDPPAMPRGSVMDRESPVPERLRRLVDTMRADTLSPESVERVARRLGPSLAPPGGDGSGTGSAGNGVDTGASGASKAGLGVKLLLVLGLVIAGAAAIYRWRAPSSAPKSEQPTSPPVVEL